ncbi:major capsid protein [Kineobactrum salinum]|uniref:Phage coat protein n=1 Tax=Kineobactrum salinum TaxID=2708301 RepID=A0A6C0U4D5_9GAMM|nr:major capsid protein [Kineobactrum salinum]QIB66971.1 hypothetical protein G3T16_17830 [Kineobactrum salinum]
MAVVQILDVIVPAEFTDYIVQNTFERTALVMSGVAARNAVIEQQLQAGADSFSVPFWNDLANDEANVTNDNPASFSTPKKINAAKQQVRKSFLHQSWSAMNLASELAGSNALVRVQGRVTSYWDRQIQRRLIASLEGILADNIASDDEDLVLDITGEAGDAAKFSASAVIDATESLGDNLSAVSAIAMHSDIYRTALKNDLIATIQDSAGRPFQTFRGLAVVVDDGLPKEDVSDPEDPADYNYTSVLFGPGAVGWGMSSPRVAEGTEVENIPSAGNGAGQQILHSRLNLAIHPAGFKWDDGSVAGESPTIAELKLAANWSRVVERKAVPLAFLVSKN